MDTLIKLGNVTSEKLWLVYACCSVFIMHIYKGENMDNLTKNQTPPQVFNYEFQPDFSAALGRERNAINDDSNQVSDISTNIEDSFGSWREWD